MPGYINKQVKKYQHEMSKKNIHHIQQNQRNMVNQKKNQYHQMNIPMLAQIESLVFIKLLVDYFVMPDPSTQQFVCQYQHWQVNNQKRQHKWSPILTNYSILSSHILKPRSGTMLHIWSLMYITTPHTYLQNIHESEPPSIYSLGGNHKIVNPSVWMALSSTFSKF